MDHSRDRFVIYAALVLLCSAVGAFLGLAAAAWSFFQIAVVVELLQWWGLPGREGSDTTRSQVGQ